LKFTLRIFRLLLLLMCILLAGLIPSVAAAGEAPSMKVRAAYDGTFKYGEWLPMMVEIENPGGDLETELRVAVANQNYSVVFAVPVSLPAGAHKLVPLYALPNNYSHQLEVRLVSKDGETLLASEKVKVSPQANITFLVGILANAGQRGAISLLNGIELISTQTRPIELTDLTVGDLPERPEGLDSLDMLVLNDVDTSQLSQEQATALQSWVRKGGRLVIGGGAGTGRTLAGLPEALQPVRLEGALELETSALGGLAEFAGAGRPDMSGKFLVARVAPQEARILAGDQAQPLVIERSLNRGTIDFVALDLATAPFEGWSGTMGFWQKLVEPGAAYPEGMPVDMSLRQMRSGSFYGALTNIPTLDLPSLGALSALLLAYIVLVGPVNYLVLRRMHRLHLAWVTIPLLTLLFAGGAFGIGYALRGTDLILNKIAIVETQPEGPAQVTTYIGLFSPRRQSYQIEVRGAGLISPGEQYYNVGTAQPEMVFVQGEPSLVRGLAVNQWSMQSFQSEGTWDGFGTLSGDLRLKGDILTGTVRNDTPYPLKEVVIAINRRFQKLGNLAPGQEAQVDLGLAELNRDWNGMNLSYKLYMDPPSKSQMTREEMMKTSVIDNVIEGGPWAATNTASGQGRRLRSAVVFGWTDQAPPEVGVRGQLASQVATALAYTLLPLQLPEQGRLDITPGLLTGRLVETSNGMGTCSMPGITSVYMDNTQATFEFTLPQELSQVQVDALKLAISRDNFQARLKELALYDWQQGQWTEVNQTQAEGALTTVMILRAPAAFIGQAGQVRVRLTNETGNPGCYLLDFGLEGTR